MKQVNKIDVASTSIFVDIALRVMTKLVGEENVTEQMKQRCVDTSIATLTGGE